jgi:hypothetical protein
MKSHARHCACLLIWLSSFGTLAHVAAQEAGAPAAPAAGAKQDGPPEYRAVQPKGEPDPQQAARPVRQQRKAPPRHHVWQVVGPEPTVNLGPVYSPTLTPRPPAGAMPAPVPGVAPVLPGPAPLNSCTGNLCTDASGSQYNIGTGNAGTDGRGRLCNRVGTTVQCF